MKNLLTIIVAGILLTACSKQLTFDKGRKRIKPDILIWMDTIKKGRFKENSIDHLFEKPINYTFRIKQKNSNLWVKKIIKYIKD